jgi:hypothetical protein
MDPREVMRQADEVYMPFDQAEVRVLRRYVHQAEALAGSRLLKDPPRRLVITGTTDPPSLGTEMSAVDDDDLRAALMVFRSLYSAQEPASARKVLKLLSGTPGSMAVSRALSRTAC